jgi:cbb3-type cytochrome oxidase subunit 3
MFSALLAATDPNSINLRPGGQFGQLDFTIPQLISAAIQFIFVIAAVIFFFMLVIGGVRWILSGGDKAQTEAARNQITAALVGLVIIFAAWAIVQLLSTFFGIQIFNGLTIPQVKNQ